MLKLQIKNLGWIICLLAFALQGCQSEKDEYNFLFVGHTYDWSYGRGDKVDKRLELVNLDDYDGFWLGGDICASTTLQPKTMSYLDDLFDLRNPNTHFVLGNHDYRDNNLDFYFKATGRPDYYTYSFKNLVISVLNTNLNPSDCENLDAQYKMIVEACDTITNASHYVLLMHHQIFKNIDGIQNFKSNGICDHYAMNCDSVDSYFEFTIYPKLVDLKERGVEVIIVVGDTGWDKGSEKESVEGVRFLASGINNSYYIGKDVKAKDLKKDKVIIFTLYPKERILDYKYVELNELSDVNFNEWFKSSENLTE